MQVLICHSYCTLMFYYVCYVLVVYYTLNSAYLSCSFNKHVSLETLETLAEQYEQNNKPVADCYPTRVRLI